MKTTLMTLLAGTALLSLFGTAQASSDISNNGIVASPKYRQVLAEQKPATPAISVSQQMACDACKDQVTTRTDMNARGANKPTVTTTHHTCSAGKTASCCGTGT